MLYKNWPDFRILLTEQQLRTAPRDDVPVVAAESLIDGFFVPYSVEALGYEFAHAQVAAESPNLSSLDRAIAAFQPGGFFCLRSPSVKLM